MDLHGRKALVTGAAGGIGRAIVNRLLSGGAEVVAADREIDDSSKGTSATHWIIGDLLDPTYADQLPINAAQELGGLDLVVNNAGVITRGSVTETSDADWSLSVGSILRRHFESVAPRFLFWPRMSRALSSTSRRVGAYGPGLITLYCMTKAALALTQCMGMDHAHQGIRVNAVCPNEVNTPMLRSGFERRGFDADSAVAELGKTVTRSHCGA